MASSFHLVGGIISTAFIVSDTEGDHVVRGIAVDVIHLDERSQSVVDVVGPELLGVLMVQRNVFHKFLAVSGD